MGSNHRPTGYEPAALTPELHPRGYLSDYSVFYPFRLQYLVEYEAYVYSASAAVLPAQASVFYRQQRRHRGRSGRGAQLGVGIDRHDAAKL